MYRRLGTAAFLGWCLLVAWLTLTPGPSNATNVQGQCVLCGELGGADFIRNLLMFMPAGVILAVRGVSPLLGVGAGLLMSAAFELAQVFVDGRHASLRDVLINGLGVGAGIVLLVFIRHGQRDRSYAPLILAAAIVPVVVSLTGVFFRPASTDGAYFAQWVPIRAYYAPWNGNLLSAQVGARSTTIGRLKQGAAVRHDLASGAPVRLRLTRGEATASLTAFYAIVDDSKREILMIGAVGDDLVARQRLLASSARLDRPYARFANLLSGRLPTDTIALEVWSDSRGRLCARLDEGTRCDGLPPVGAAWRLVLWRGTLPEVALRILDGLALALLLAPLMLIVAPRGTRAAGLALAATLGTSVIVGRLVGLAWPGVAELIAVGALMALSLALVPQIGHGGQAYPSPS